LKVINSIRAFFLLLAAMAVAVHMVVPHDHHLSGSAGGLKNSCHSSPGRSHHRPLFPTHCHAFNDLAAEKFSRVIIKQETQTSFTSIVWYPDHILPDKNLSLLMIYSSGKPFPDIYIPDYSPFRGPPHLS
jgi:hypothetical protein